MIARMYEDAAERLMVVLVAAFGTGPRWELLPNRSYGFYLHYDADGIALPTCETSSTPRSTTAWASSSPRVADARCRQTAH
jgi:hypothetical protein